MYKIGDRIRIIKMNDPYSGEKYINKEGTVTFIDDIGQLFGTWGGLAVIPEIDEIQKIN